MNIEQIITWIKGWLSSLFLLHFFFVKLMSGTWDLDEKRALLIFTLVSFQCWYCMVPWFYNVSLQMKQCCYATAADTKSKVIKPGMSKSTNVQLEPWVSEALANNTVKAKQHPGRLVLPTVTLPQRLQDAASVLLESEWTFFRLVGVEKWL